MFAREVRRRATKTYIVPSSVQFFLARQSIQRRERERGAKALCTVRRTCIFLILSLFFLPFSLYLRQQYSSLSISSPLSLVSFHHRLIGDAMCPLVAGKSYRKLARKRLDLLILFRSLCGTSKKHEAFFVYIYRRSVLYIFIYLVVISQNLFLYYKASGHAQCSAPVYIYVYIMYKRNRGLHVWRIDGHNETKLFQSCDIVINNTRSY